MEETKTKKPEVENEKVMAALAYIIFFLPLLTAKDSKFAMFHANQGFNLFLFGVVTWIGGTLITMMSFGLLFFVPMLGGIASLVFFVLGLMNALNGEEKELPLIGKYKLLKL